MQPLYAGLPEIARAVYLSKNLEKIASTFKDDPNMCRRASEARMLVNAEIFGMVKKAAVEDAASKVLPALGQGLGRGLAYGAGIAAPVVLGGAYLMHRAKNNAAETARDVRNQILLTALGLGGVGAGLYGLKRLGEKQASLRDEAKLELLEKLATVGILEDLFSGLDREKLSSESRRMANEMQLMNRDYGVQLLFEAMR
jgi:hypothetical protein